jgi:hypothetical protein
MEARKFVAAKTLAGVIAVLIVALLFAGCGGGSSAEPEPTKAEGSSSASMPKPDSEECEQLVITLNSSSSSSQSFEAIDAVRNTCTQNHFVSSANRVRLESPGGFFSRNPPKEWLASICGKELPSGGGFAATGFLVCR